MTNAIPSTTTILNQCHTFLKAEEYESCSVLAEMALTFHNRRQAVEWQLEEVLGDCARGEGRYECAVSWYRRALEDGAIIADDGGRKVTRKVDLVRSRGEKIPKKEEEVEVDVIEVGVKESQLQVPSHRYPTRHRRRQNLSSVHPLVDDENQNSIQCPSLTSRTGGVKSNGSRYYAMASQQRQEEDVEEREENERSHVLEEKKDDGDDFHGEQEKESNEIRLRLKMSQCYSKLKKYPSALTCLTAIHPTNRTYAVHVKCGKLYELSGQRNSACQSYLEALKLMPFCTSCVSAALRLGVGKILVKEAINTGTACHDGHDGSNVVMLDLMEALHASRRFDYESSLKYYKSLSAKFPNHRYILAKTAVMQYEQNDRRAATASFDTVRRLDKHCIDQMDKYANILYVKQERQKLNRLANDLLNVNADRPETWIAASFLAKINDDFQKSLDYANKAIQADRTNSFAHKVQGQLYLDLNEPQHAVMSFFRALEIERDMGGFEGLIDAYLKANKFKDAIITAKNAIQTAPSNPRALTLVGTTFAKAAPGKDTQERAKRALNKALIMDPYNFKSMNTLISIYNKEGDFESSEHLILSCIDRMQSNEHRPYLHTKLGNLYANQRRFTEALENFHTAMHLKPKYVPAQQGMDRLEKILAGEGYYQGESVSVDNLD